MRRLRDLEGVADAELFFRTSRPRAGERDWPVEERLDRLSHALFGVTEDEMREPWQAAEGSPEWQEWADTFELPDSELTRVEFFARVGWDVTDERGDELMIMARLERQLEAAMKGRLGAHLPPEEASSWAKRLQSEAAVFSAGRSAGPKFDPRQFEPRRGRRRA